MVSESQSSNHVRLYSAYLHIGYKTKTKRTSFDRSGPFQNTFRVRVYGGSWMGIMEDPFLPGEEDKVVLKW